MPQPDNLSVGSSFRGTSNSGYNIGTALLDAIFSFQGYDNLNAVSAYTKIACNDNPKLIVFSGPVRSQEPSAYSSHCSTNSNGPGHCALCSGEHRLCKSLSFCEQEPPY